MSGDGSLYCINGFYIKMREAYTSPGEAMYYYSVEWDSSTLSWEDFRGKFLGGTNPSKAQEGSLRRTVYDNYADYKLDDEPNVGNNCFHGSASPLEGLAERLNWLEAKVGDDGFGKALLDSGISEETIMEWVKDPTVDYDGSKQSVFDIFEDVSVTECLAIAQKIAGVDQQVSDFSKHMAFVFVKPHAVKCESVKTFFNDQCKESNISIISEGLIEAETIEEKKFIDTHYLSIAQKAVSLKPKSLTVSEEKQSLFEKKFGISWTDALEKNLVFNAVDICEDIHITSEELNTMWGNAQKENLLFKFGGGFYCGKVTMAGVCTKKGKIINGIEIKETVEKVGGKVCDSCLKPLSSDDAVKSDGSVYHLSCLMKSSGDNWKCSKCNVPFVGLPKKKQVFVIRQQLPVCVTCTDKEKVEAKENPEWIIKCRGATCEKCGKTINDENVVSLIMGVMHPECMICYVCNKQIDVSGPKQKFFESSRGNCCTTCVTCTTCKKPIDLDKEHREEATGIYHTDCPSQIVGVPCGGCDDGITGSFEIVKGVKYHTKCFKCAHCGKQLLKKLIVKSKKLYCNKRCWRTSALKK